MDGPHRALPAERPGPGPSLLDQPLAKRVVVEDRGPGIPDVEQAMQPGWSTAAPEIREMGFGAGLGLPNIRGNVDFLKITSEVGEGTVLEFAILLNRP